MKSKKTILPSELLYELINFIPLNIKWAKIRVSLIFDFFILKHQIKWIKYLKILKKKVVSLLKQLVATFKEIFGKDFEKIELLVFLNSRIEDFPFELKKRAEKSTIVMPDYTWPTINLSDKDYLKSCFVDRKNILIAIFEELLEFIEPMDESAVTDWKEWEEFLDVKLSIAKMVKCQANTNCLNKQSSTN
ncbi:hypothetical protein ACQ4LE_009303 [Meloidogyne hapla]